MRVTLSDPSIDSGVSRSSMVTPASRRQTLSDRIRQISSWFPTIQIIDLRRQRFEAQGRRRKGLLGEHRNR